MHLRKGKGKLVSLVKRKVLGGVLRSMLESKYRVGGP